MKKHIKNYFKHFGYVHQNEIFCEVCDRPAKAIHHIDYGRFKRSDEVDNLIALCDLHHKCAHHQVKPYLTKEELYDYKIRLPSN